MIIALFALSLAMILGGLLSAVLGWDIVLVERGWTMVLAGSISAASGALLLGITAAVSKLTKIQAELVRLHAGLNEEVPAALPEPATGLSLAALAGGLFGGGALGAAAAAAAGKEAQKSEEQKNEELPPLPLFPEMDRAEKEAAITARAPEQREEAPAETVDLSEEDRISDDLRMLLGRSSRPPEEAPEVKVPDFLIAERYRETTYTEVRIPEPDETLYAPEPVIESRPETRLDEPEEAPAETSQGSAFEEPRASAEPVSEVEPEREAEPEPETKVEPVKEETPTEPRTTATVIGTYDSGDNTYVMFSDGSIEAQTPRGVFHFKSLDELKEFIASGGESGSTPAI